MAGQPEVLEEDIRLFRKAHINCVSLGIFSWAKLEPEEGVYDFGWLDEIIDRLYANGIYTVLATPSGARPQWLAQKYPEVLRVRPDGLRNFYGHRQNHCYTSPLYREKVTQIDTRLAEHYANHPAMILWHISNEFGGECHCELCQAAFREWVQKKYGTLDKLNHAWWANFWSHTYTDWSQVHSPSPVGETSVHGLDLDWRRFVTHQTIDFMKTEIAAVKAVNPDIPVTTNMMTMYTYELNYFAFRDALDVISWDNYPEWHNPYMGNEEVAKDCAMTHDMMRSLQKKPFLLMECTPNATNWQGVSKLKKPGMHQLSVIEAVAHGADSGQYFQLRQSRGSCEKFHSAVISNTRHGKHPDIPGSHRHRCCAGTAVRPGYTAAARRRKRRSCSTRKTNGRWTNARGRETSGWTISGISAGTTAISGKTASMWISSTAPLTSAATSW